MKDQVDSLIQNGISATYINSTLTTQEYFQAIENAKQNMKLNNIQNAEYVCGKAEEQIVKWMNSNIPATSIVVDPPRKGCDEQLLKTICDMDIRKVVYVSCNPATLARDLKYLVENNYEIQYVQPVDMFPQSSHIETVVYLVRKYK